MNRYIKFEDAVKVMACEMYAEAQSQGYEVDSIEDFIPEAKAWMNDAPSADRPQGEWIEDGGIEKCNQCGERKEFPHWNFCPNCGADMRNSSEKPNNCEDEQTDCQWK